VQLLACSARSAWCDAGAGDAVDLHHYPTPARPADNASGAKAFEANGEFGGIGLALPGHEWVTGGCHGYGDLVANGTVRPHCRSLE
jgi:hypothetical protein